MGDHHEQIRKAEKTLEKANSILLEVVKKHGAHCVFPLTMVCLRAISGGLDGSNPDQELAARYNAGRKKIHEGIGELIGALGVIVERDAGGDGSLFEEYMASLGVAVMEAPTKEKGG